MTTGRRANRRLAILVGLLAAALSLPTIALAADSTSGSAADRAAIGLTGRSSSEGTLLRYARDTWASLDAMTDPTSGLPADSLLANGSPVSRRRPRTSARTCRTRSSPTRTMVFFVLYFVQFHHV